MARPGAWNGRVWGLAGPIILSNLSTPLLGAVDTAVVGHLPDPAYLGGVAVGAMIFSFLYWGFGFLRMGTTGFAAQAFGLGDSAELRATFARPLLLAILIGIGLILLQRPISAVAFGLVDASGDVEVQARSYFAIRIWSAPAALINYCLLGWLLGLQRAGTVLFLQVFLNGANIVLDLLFVIGFGWGVEGVALASLLAEIAAAGLGLALAANQLKHMGGLWDRRRILDRHRLIALLRVNVDILIRTLCLVAAFAYLTARGASMGDRILAANAILMQLQYIVAYGLDGFAHAAEVLAGNAVGAGKRNDFRRAMRVSTAWALGLAVLVTLVYALAGPWIIYGFTDLPQVREIAVSYLPWLIASPVLSVWSFQLDGIFIGATRTGEMRNAMIASLACFLLACWLLIPPFGNDGLWAAFLVLMIARGLTLALYYPALVRSVGELRGEPQKGM